MPTGKDETNDSHSVSVVVPVYGGELSLPVLIEELRPLTELQTSGLGNRFAVTEVVLVNDCGSDGSEHVIRELAERNDWVTPVWLSRNFGQHAATLAGMAVTGGDWIVTLDEDGQQNPADIGAMLDCAVVNGAQLVYARASNAAPHGLWRNLASRWARVLFTRVLTDGQSTYFNSYRLMFGEVGRVLSAYVGSGVYLDVALSWVVNRTAACDVELRPEVSSASGYGFSKLVSHFGRLVLTSGTRPLRFASVLGIVASGAGMVLAVAVVIGKVLYGYSAPGWASVFLLVLITGGIIMLLLGVVAEYLGVVVRASLGRPLYVTIGDPALSALRRLPDSEGHDG